ncbi:hypothetical protein FB451DRAFT_1187433 [Mycena latifolia]|nr:hypothetical protein FB451DRAFT_1187433 [Mycena latifolia]
MAVKNTASPLDHNAHRSTFAEVLDYCLGGHVLFDICALRRSYANSAPLSESTLQVTKDFRALVSAKQLWISVVRELSWRYLIDPPAEENLEKLSAIELLHIVKRGVGGPLKLSPASSTPPTLARKIDVATWMTAEDISSSSMALSLHDDGYELLVEVTRNTRPALVKQIRTRRTSTGLPAVIVPGHPAAHRLQKPLWHLAIGHQCGAPLHVSSAPRLDEEVLTP